MARTRRALGILAVAGLAGLAALAGLWFSGGAARVLTEWGAGAVLPYRVDPEFTVTEVGRAARPTGAADGLIRLSVSPGRVKRAVAEAGVSLRWFPPGLLEDGLYVRAVWTPSSRDQALGIAIPVELHLMSTEGDHPHLAGALPVSMLNAFMNVEFAEDFINEREEYFLGHYDYEFRPTIDEASIRTTNAPALPPGAYAERIGLDVRAKGTVDLKFRENLFRTSTDAKISNLHLVIEVRPQPTETGTVLTYQARFLTLRGNVRKLHSMGDKRVAEKLQEKWERSLNKEKRRRKLARHPIPVWAPLDWIVDLTFIPDEAVGGEAAGDPSARGSSGS